MKRSLYYGGAASAIASSLLLAVPAFAAPVGTQVGQTIENTVDVTFRIGTIDQVPIQAVDEVAVDRKVNLTLVRTDNVETPVNPGETDVAVSFTLSNQSNDSLDFALSAANEVSTTTSQINGSEADNIDAEPGFTYYLDDGNGIFDGGDTLITHVDALASGDSVVIHVVADFDTGYSTGDRAIVTLTATAREDDGAATLGAAFTAATSNSADVMVVDTVFADTDDNGQTARDGQAFASDDFLISAADLTATKSSRIVAGAFAGDTTGTYLPGATIEYCILVTNPSGGAAASDVSISDVLPSQVTYDAVYGVKVGGADCDTPGLVDGAEAGGTVTGDIGTLTAGSSQSVIFRATIN